MDRVIYHCDCNSFYCSVELLSRPELRAVPTAVCGDPKSRHGIILAKTSPPNGWACARRRPSGRRAKSART